MLTACSHCLTPSRFLPPPSKAKAGARPPATATGQQRGAAGCAAANPSTYRSNAGCCAQRTRAETATAAVTATATRRFAAAALLGCALPPKKTMVVPLFICCGSPAACGFCPVDFTLLRAKQISERNGQQQAKQVWELVLQFLVEYGVWIKHALDCLRSGPCPCVGAQTAKRSMYSILVLCPRGQLDARDCLPLPFLAVFSLAVGN